MPSFEKKSERTRCSTEQMLIQTESAGACFVLVTAGESKHDRIKRFQHAPSLAPSHTSTPFAVIPVTATSEADLITLSLLLADKTRTDWAPGVCLPYLPAWSFVRQSLGILYLPLCLPNERWHQIRAYVCKRNGNSEEKKKGKKKVVSRYTCTVAIESVENRSTVQRPFSCFLS